MLLLLLLFFPRKSDDARTNTMTVAALGAVRKASDRLTCPPGCSADGGGPPV